MKTRGIAIIPFVALLFCSSVNAQLLPDPFRYDLPAFFAGVDGKTWVGHASMLNANYTDTVQVRYDAVDKSLLIRRVLIDADEKRMVSYGIGLITLGNSDSVHAIQWTERSYPEATGRLYWDPEYQQWRANFDGRWNQWFINIRRIDDSSFEAGVARKVASFPAVELLDATYRCITKP